MTFLRRFIFAWRISRVVPSFRPFDWTRTDREQLAAWLRSSTGQKMLQDLQNRVFFGFYRGADQLRNEETQRAMGIWRAVAIIKTLSEDEPNLDQLSGIPAPAQKQDAKDAPTEHANLEYLFP
jgi:hypothetical protein